MAAGAGDFAAAFAHGIEGLSVDVEASGQKAALAIGHARVVLKCGVGRDPFDFVRSGPMPAMRAGNLAEY